MNITRWTSDHCGCSIEYSWDPNLPQEERIHNYHDTHKACDAHKVHEKKQTHLTAVMAENRSKNIAKDLFEKTFPTADKTKFNYSFDENRDLVIDHPIFRDKVSGTLNKANFDTNISGKIEKTIKYG